MLPFFLALTIVEFNSHFIDITNAVFSMTTILAVAIYVLLSITMIVISAVILSTIRMELFVADADDNKICDLYLLFSHEKMMAV